MNDAQTFGNVYRDNLAALQTAVIGLTVQQLATTVPATPAWSAKDLVAHLAGVGADSVDPSFQGSFTPDVTARQVDERSERTTADLLAELQRNQDAVIASLDPSKPNPAADMAIHYADLVEALGLSQPDESLWRPVLDLMAGKIGESLANVDPYEQFRSVFSRRSRRQLAELAGGPSPELDSIGAFGPRDDDQPRPAT